MPITRRTFLNLAAGALPGAAQRSAPGPLSVVVLLADDLGWADTGIYGADLHETPNIDRLARQGTRFTNAYSAAPVCTPTRASIMTGKHPARLHMTIWREASRKPPLKNKLIPPVTESDLPHDEVTLAEALRDAGYSTAHVGKWHLGGAEHYPETQGFDINIGGTVWGAPPTFFYPYRGSQRWGGEYRYVPRLEGGRPGEYLTDRLTQEALKILDTVKDRPFFLYLAFHTVHTPIEGKPELVERYKTKLRPGGRHQNAGYAAMVHSLDENVGRVMARLDELGVSERTAVLFTSDNGGYIGNYKGETVTNNHPLRSGKGSLYEGGIRVPLLVRWAGMAGGAVCHEPVVSTDLYPTILAAAGAKPQALDGMSIVPLLKEPASALPREDLFFHYPHYCETTSPVSALRARNWKLLEYHEDNHVELYDLSRDLGEANNLAAARPDKAQELLRRLHGWRNAVNAQMPAPNPDFRPPR